MNKLAEMYLEASESPRTLRTDFDSLVSQFSDLPKEVEAATVSVKKKLQEKGFEYNHSSFLAHDVLRTQSGNCLGLPLLIGAILGEFGFVPQYQVVVNPQDKIYELETEFFKRKNEETPYDSTDIECYQAEYPPYRFAPLEHLVLDANGQLIETTNPEHTVSQFESARQVTFEQALSCLFKDRAIELNNKGRKTKAKKLALEGLKLWPDNRQIYAFLGGLADEDGDVAQFTEAKNRFIETAGTDSLSNFNKYLFSDGKDAGALDSALLSYPQYAPAIAAKAHSLTSVDSREARFLYVLASKLYATSHVLNLRDFYVTHAQQLKQLFGRERVRDAMLSQVYQKV